MSGWDVWERGDVQQAVAVVVFGAITGTWALAWKWYQKRKGQR